MGMSNRIGRRVFITECDCITVKGNEPVKVTVTLYGDYNSDKRIANAVKKKLNTEQVLVKSATRRSLYYSMPVDKFIEYADKVTEKKEN